MQEFAKETQTLERIIYKSKNAHRSALYFRKMVHVKRLGRKLLEVGRRGQPAAHIRRSLQEQCVAAYVALSSCLGAGHYLGLAIGSMAAVAKIFSLAPDVSAQQQEAEEEKSDEISDIFSRF